MSLNKYMHPRNKYKNKKPNFLELALKYPDFRKQVTQDDSGKVFLDFKNADALRALTTCLLKEDFDLTVHLPSDRLVPTVPLRLNYLLWLEDIVGTGAGKWGVDVGTGASCVYPLLGKTVQGWNFLATEADSENFYHAKKNVETNNAQEHIHVKHVSVEDIILEPVESFKDVEKFDFCMCNPPFFADHMEAQAVSTTRSVDRTEAHSVSTASPQECIAQGGEVGFIRQMIEESTILKNRIRVYSSMVGKKASLVQLKEELRQLKVPKFATTDFCQGKTMRWGIAWSFDESINFPRSPFESKKEKKVKNIQFAIPEGPGGVQYNVHSIASFLKNILTSIKVHCYQGKVAKSYTSITLTAPENTWCHQRRQRRQKNRQAQKETTSEKSNTDDKNTTDDICSEDEDKAESACCETNCTTEQKQSGEVRIKSNIEASSVEHNLNDVDDGREAAGRKRLLQDEGNLERESEVKPAKVLKIDEETGESQMPDVKEMKSHSNEEGSSPKKQVNADSKEKASNDSIESSPKKQLITNEEGSSPKKQADADSKEKASDDSIESSPTKKQSEAVEGTTESPKEYVLKCVMRLKRAGDVINMELEWLDGASREFLHQVKTFLINKLKENQG